MGIFDIGFRGRQRSIGQRNDSIVFDHELADIHRCTYGPDTILPDLYLGRKLFFIILVLGRSFTVRHRAVDDYFINRQLIFLHVALNLQRGVVAQNNLINSHFIFGVRIT